MRVLRGKKVAGPIESQEPRPGLVIRMWGEQGRFCISVHENEKPVFAFHQQRQDEAERIFAQLVLSYEGSAA